MDPTGQERPWHLTPHMLRLTPDDLKFLATLAQVAGTMGMRAFLVGGCVRDLILGREHADWDIVVEGDGTQFATAAAEHLGGAATVYERFLTATLELPGGQAVDVATARRETYSRPGALPQVAPASIEEDLWRRDFSINAVAMELGPSGPGRILDPTGGVVDMKRGRVRALHARSFWDDATRIVRAIGFEQRLGFHIEPQTEGWMRAASREGALQTVSTERLGEAVLPLLANSVGPRVLLRANELEVVRGLGARGAFTRRTCRGLAELPEALVSLGENENPRSRMLGCLSALLLSRGVQADEVAARLHLDRDTTRQLRAAERYLSLWPRGYVAAERAGDVWRELRGACLGAILALWLSTSDARSRQALALYWLRLRHTRADIDPRELLPSGARPGPLLGEALARACWLKLNENASPEEQLSAARAIMAAGQRSM